jgi:hypothetical protein
VNRHLIDGGLAVFNSPINQHTREWYTGDGLGTTLVSRHEIVAAYCDYFSTVEIVNQNKLSSCDLFVVRKI